MTHTVTVRYFASLREKAGLSVEQIETTSQSARELYEELSERYGFQLAEKHLKLSVNRAYHPFETLLKDGDEVVFIPPVSGG